ncbi:MAG TPA: cupin domain-containing protein [Candidatus Omnitrophota bacterium]|nr:cupin domain-containing protein [Candidatus Omnitrophota bacterium]
MAKRPDPKNFYSKAPDPKDGEVFELLTEGAAFKVERIVSRGQATERGRWLKEPADEWVMVLKGEGRLKVKGRARPVVLKPGDHFFIPAGTSHRVEWTAPRAKTLWLAVTEKRKNGKRNRSSMNDKETRGHD